jgi:hypothetical protein
VLDRCSRGRIEVGIAEKKSGLPASGRPGPQKVAATRQIAKRKTLYEVLAVLVHQSGERNQLKRSIW